MNTQQQQFQQLFDDLIQFIPFKDCTEDSSEASFLSKLELLTVPDSSSEDSIQQGQQLLCQLIALYPQLSHLINRQLLWRLGGDCLHYMTDEEISRFQQVDELLYQNADMDFNTAIAMIDKNTEE